jgi:hypothetical protein
MVLRTLIVTLIFSYSSYSLANTLLELKNINRQIKSGQYEKYLFVKGSKLRDTLENDSELSDEAEEEIESFEEAYLVFKNNQYGTSYFIAISYLTWNTRPYLDRNNDTDVDLFSEEKGPCLGAGLKYQSTKHGFESSLCYAFLDATVGEENSTTVYFNQNDVEIDALLLQSFYLYRLEKDTTFKIGIPFIYRQSKYGILDAGEVKDSSNILYGYSVGASWALKDFSLDLSFGSIPVYKSSIWSLQLSYDIF